MQIESVCTSKTLYLALKNTIFDIQKHRFWESKTSFSHPKTMVLPFKSPGVTKNILFIQVLYAKFLDDEVLNFDTFSLHPDQQLLCVIVSNKKESASHEATPIHSYNSKMITQQQV